MKRIGIYIALLAIAAAFAGCDGVKSAPVTNAATSMQQSAALYVYELPPPPPPLWFAPFAEDDRQPRRMHSNH